MVDRGTVVWAPDPFKTDGGNPRPWLVVSDERMPYPEKESIVVAFTTQSHHPGALPSRLRRGYVANRANRVTSYRGR